MYNINDKNRENNRWWLYIEISFEGIELIGEVVRATL